MDWEAAKTAADDPSTHTIPNRWLLLHYYEALNILFRVENSLRVLVYVVLKANLKDKWSTVTIVSDDGEGTIESIAKKRKHQAATFGYLGYPVTSPLMYLNTGELSKLITSESYWNFFRPDFLGSKTIVTAKLDELISVRNALAHFRPIKLDDVDTIKQVTKHVMTTAENTLSELTGFMTTVPTNTNEKWYSEISVLGTTHCKLGFKQSSSEKWLRIELSYTPPFQANMWSARHFNLQTMKLNSPAILREHPALTREVIYLIESGYATIRMDQKHKVTETLLFGFSRQNLIDVPDIIKKEIEGVLGVIEEETELIRKDNLARGKLISSAGVPGQIPEGQNAAYTTTGLESGFKEDDPSEWWGRIHLYGEDFISSIDTFPWMPTQIATQQF